jgi:hypothetical protein
MIDVLWADRDRTLMGRCDGLTRHMLRTLIAVLFGLKGSVTTYSVQCRERAARPWRCALHSGKHRTAPAQSLSTGHGLYCTS